MIKKLISIVAFLVASGGTTQANAQQTWEQSLPAPPQSDRLSLRQEIQLGMGSLRPAYYMIRPTHAQKCLRQVPGGLFEKPHLKLANCNPADPQQLFAIIQFEAGQDATIHSAGKLEGTNLVECAKSARGVVFGPTRVDLLPCSDAEEPDRIDISWQPERSAFRIFHHKQVKFIDSELKADLKFERFCWAVRGAGRSDDTDVILWPCEEGAEQFFNLTEIRQLERNTLARERIQYSQWWWHVDGYRRSFKADGISLGGIDYAAFETIADSGSYCRQRCVESPQCKAYMWTSANYEDYLGERGKRVPMCHLKSSAGTPVDRGLNYQYLVNSGIIRP